MQMSLLYIGAGLDTSILKADRNHNRVLKDIDIFVFVDSQPMSSFGLSSPSLESKDFLKKLKREMKSVGYRKIKRFKLKEEGDPKTKHQKGVVVFQSNKKLVYYFYSTIVRQDVINSHLRDFIKLCNVLYICGHDPEQDVIADMQKPLTFIGASETVYDNRSTEVSHSVFSKIHTHIDEISEWFLLDTNTLDIVNSDYESFFSNNDPISVDDSFFEKQSDFCMY